MRSSYHQVELEAADADKTAFICREGMFKFVTTPFGLCNAGATFQRVIDMVLSGLSFDVCLAYIDDVIIFSKTIDDHFVRLRLVLERLQGAGLKLKPSKCFLLQKSVAFLGHVVSAEGVAAHPDKTKAVAEWPVPTCVRDVRAWLGSTGYYRRYVKHYASVAAPLTSALQQGVKFEWTEEMQRSFDELKAALTSPPVLAMPTPDGVFTLDTDASDLAIGGVLSQAQGGSERVIAYASRKLSRTEKNYSVTRRELLAIVHFMKYFRHYLLGVRFRIRTDHAALLWLHRIPEPVGQQARWLELMKEYTFFVEHRPGKSHANADALSRLPTRVVSGGGNYALQADDEAAELETTGSGLALANPSDDEPGAVEVDTV